MDQVINDVIMVSKKDHSKRVVEVFYHGTGGLVAQELYDDSGNHINLSGQVPDGIVKEYYCGGQLKQIIIYRRNKPNGKNTIYYPEGELWVEQYMEDGMLEGESTTYYRDGIIGEESFYKTGKLEGKQSIYFDNGDKQSIAYFRNGIPEGKFQRLYRHDLLQEVCYYCGGVLHGVRKVFHESGEMSVIEYYDSDKLVYKMVFDETDIPAARRVRQQVK